MNNINALVKKIYTILNSKIIYLIAAFLSFTILVLVLKLWKADFYIPFTYSGDALLNSMLVKGNMDNGWYLINKYLGAPSGLNMNDYPLFVNLDLLIMKIFSIYTNKVALVYNLYYITTYLFVTLTSVYVLRKFNITNVLVISISIIFTFLLYHFLRGENHIFLSAYFLIPFSIMLALWVYSDEISVLIPSDKSIRNIVIKNKKIIISIISCILISSSYVYYAFFTAIFMIIAGISAYINRRKFKPLLISGTLVLVIISGLLFNGIPSVISKYNNGSNVFVAERSPSEAEYLGLKVSQLILPASNHRIIGLSKMKEIYDKSAPIPNENSESLGVVGSFGFILLLFWLLFIKSQNDSIIHNSELKAQIGILSVLNASAIFIGTIGGFGSIFSYFVSSKIRAYNRISIFIAFISLFSLALILNYFYNEFLNNKVKKNIFKISICILLIVSIADQTNSTFIPNYEFNKVEFLSDKSFIEKIEDTLPEDSMIYQLPFVPFPENPPVIKMTDYDNLKGYMHSTKLRWSYGTMKGRKDYYIQKELSQKSIENQLKSVSLLGFSGIYIDTFGYKDDGKEVISKLCDITNVQPIISDNKRLLFFDIRNYKNMIAHENYNLTINPIWCDGFYDLEGTSTSNWRWCSSSGTLIINNAFDFEKTLVIEMGLKNEGDKSSNLIVESSLFKDRLQINENEKLFTKTIRIPKGDFSIKFKCDGKKLFAPEDSRNLVFKVNNFKIIELTD